jgi:hypothetical protein
MYALNNRDTTIIFLPPVNVFRWSKYIHEGPCWRCKGCISTVLYCNETGLVFLHSESGGIFLFYCVLSLCNGFSICYVYFFFLFISGPLTIAKPLTNLYYVYQAIETLKSFEKKDSKVASTAATNLSFLYFLVSEPFLSCFWY